MTEEIFSKTTQEVFIKSLNKKLLDTIKNGDFCRLGFFSNDNKYITSLTTIYAEGCFYSEEREPITLTQIFKVYGFKWLEKTMKVTVLYIFTPDVNNFAKAKNPFYFEDNCCKFSVFDFKKDFEYYFKLFSSKSNDPEKLEMPDRVEMTQKEIEKKLGFPIKIV